MLNVWLVQGNSQYAEELMRIFNHFTDNSLKEYDTKLVFNYIKSDYWVKIEEVLKNDRSGANLFILDIDLHEEYNGIQIAKKIRERDMQSNIIFISSHIELISYIFIHNLKVITFIDKMDPYFDQRLFSALKVVLDEMKIMKKKNKAIAVEVLQYQYKGYYYRIPFNEIVGIETNTVKRGLVINTDQKRYLYRTSMKELLEILPKEFVQIHRSIVVNGGRVREVSNTDSTYSILMDDMTTYPASHRYVGNIIKYLNSGS